MIGLPLLQEFAIVQNTAFKLTSARHCSRSRHRQVTLVPHMCHTYFRVRAGQPRHAVVKPRCGMNTFVQGKDYLLVHDLSHCSYLQVFNRPRFLLATPWATRVSHANNPLRKKEASSEWNCFLLNAEHGTRSHRRRIGIRLQKDPFDHGLSLRVLIWHLRVGVT